MGRSKLKVLHVAIIGVVLALAMLGVTVFAFVNPTKKQIEDKKTELEGLQNQANQLVANQKQLQEKTLEKAQKTAALARYENRYMRVGPNREVIDFAGTNSRTRAMITLWREQAETLGPVLERYMNRAGVRLMTPIQVPPAPTDPNAINPQEITLPFTGLQISGTWNNIMRFLRSMRTFPRLVLINNVTLSGSSPLLTANVDLTIYILPRNGDKAEPAPSVTGDTSGMGYGAGPAAGPYGAPPGYGPPPGPSPGNGAPPGNGAGS